MFGAPGAALRPQSEKKYFKSYFVQKQVSIKVWDPSRSISRGVYDFQALKTLHFSIITLEPHLTHPEPERGPACAKLKGSTRARGALEGGGFVTLEGGARSTVDCAWPPRRNGSVLPEINTRRCRNNIATDLTISSLVC